MQTRVWCLNQPLCDCVCAGVKIDAIVFGENISNCVYNLQQGPNVLQIKTDDLFRVFPNVNPTWIFSSSQSFSVSERHDIVEFGCLCIEFVSAV